MIRRPEEITVAGNGNGNGNSHDAPGSRIIIEPAPDPDKKKGQNKKLPRWPFAVLLVVLCALAVIIFFVYRGITRTAQVQMTVDDPRAAARTAADTRKSADEMTDKLVSTAAIAEARKEVEESPSGGADTLKGYPYAAAGGSSVPAGAAGTVASQTSLEAAGPSEDGVSARRPPADATPSGAPAARSPAPRAQGLPTSAANTQQSFRYTPKGDDTRGGAGRSGAGDPLAGSYSFSAREAERAATAPPPVVPPFGAMLPVRTLGAVYTLRSAGPVRLELTRDVSGRGWSLPRGTVIVATLRESEVDRAFMSVTGFIDTRAGGMVRFGGEVLGQDGANGLKGRRRVVGNAWLRAAGKVASGGSNLLQSWLAGRNGGTTIITGGQEPLNAELAGLQQRNQRRDFVEVPAGTYGYVMVSDLPPDVGGRQPAAPDPASPGVAGQMTDAEIAELLTSGTPEQIRAALPRMPYSLRVVAESVLKPGN